MTDCAVIPYREDFKSQLAKLHGDAFLFGPQKSRRYLEWKYERNPYLDEPLIFLAVDRQGVLIGMRGFYGTCWKIAGRRTVIPCADDFAIAPGARNQGLATLIMRTALEALSKRGFQYALNASGGLITVLQSLTMGWKSLGAMEPIEQVSRGERLRRALDDAMKSKPVVWRFAGQGNRRERRCFRRLDRQGRLAAERDGNVTVSSSPCPDDMAELVEGCRDDGHIAHVRDGAFFRWRFENPTREYRFLYHRSGGSLAGFLILAGRQEAVSPPCNIVDLEGRDAPVREELLRTALAWGRFPAIGAWSASLPADSRQILAGQGFAPSALERRARGMPCVLLKSLDAAAGECLVEQSAWDIRLIDSMHG